MSRPAPRPAPPRFALTVPEAAASVGMSEDSFRRHVLTPGYVRTIRFGRKQLVPCRELERLTDERAAFTLDPEAP